MWCGEVSDQKKKNNEKLHFGRCTEILVFGKEILDFEVLQRNFSTLSSGKLFLPADSQSGHVSHQQNRLEHESLWFKDSWYVHRPKCIYWFFSANDTLGHTQTHTNTHGHTRTHIDTRTYMDTHTDIHGHTQTHTGTHGHTRKYTNTHEHMCIHTHGRTHSHTETPSSFVSPTIAHNHWRHHTSHILVAPTFMRKPYSIRPLQS